MSFQDVRWDSSDEDDEQKTVNCQSNVEYETDQLENARAKLYPLEKIGASVKVDVEAAPSAGKMTITFVVDGSNFAPRDQQSNEVLRVWTSLSRNETHQSIEWDKTSGGMASKRMTFELQLDDEYVANETNVKRFDVNGKLRRDAAIWVQVLAEEQSMGNVAGLGSNGMGYFMVSDVLAASEKNKKCATPLLLHAYMDPKTNEPLVKGAVLVDSVTVHDARAKADFIHSAAPRTRFELSHQNLPVLQALMQSEILAQLAPFVDDAKKRGIAFQETMSPNAQIIAPWRMTAVGQLWAQSFIAYDRADNKLHSGEQQMDEQYMKDLFVFALRRRNWTEKEAVQILQHQLQQTDATYDDRITELMSIGGTALCMLSTSLPYKSDTRNLNRRVERLSGRSTESGEPANVESYDDAVLRLTGDCEDTGKVNKLHADMLSYGQWKSPLLQTYQRFVRDYYVPTTNLGSVTSPSLGNDAAKTSTAASWAFPDDHNLEKTAAHLADAERHHDQVERHLAAGAPLDDVPHLSVSDDTQTKHKHTRVYPPDLKEPLGGHSWAELVLLARFAELTRRIVPDLHQKDTESIFGANSTLNNEKTPAWTAYLPHMVLEGTGRIDPLVAPRVSYVINGDRNAVRLQELRYQRTLHALLQSKVFHSMESEARQAMTVHVPNTRFTSFYRQSTQMFTDKFLSSSGGIASFSWVRTHPIDERLINDSHDPNQEALAALNSNSIHLKTKQLHGKIIAAAAAHRSEHSAKIAQQRIEHTGGGVFSKWENPSSKQQQQQQQHMAKNVAISSASEEAVVLGDMVGLKTLVTDQKHDAATMVDPKNLTLGIDLEERVAWPIPSQIALVPGARLSVTGAYTLRTFQRHLPAFVIPSKKLPMLGTAEKYKAIAGIVRLADAQTGEVSSTATARLVLNQKAVQDQRRYIFAIANKTKSLFADRPWLSREDALKQDLTLVTMFFKPYDITNENVVEAIGSDLQSYRDNGVIYTADFYVEEPTQHIQNGVLRVLCVAPDRSSTQ